MSKPSSSVLTPSRKNSPPSGPSPRLDEGRVLECVPFHYPWDDWERWALDQGLDAEVAAQARLLIREWFNHSWDGWLREACGWSDDGRALLELALKAPRKALGQWDILMRTDGLRGDMQTGQWTWGHLQPDARRLRSTLNR